MQAHLPGDNVERVPGHCQVKTTQVHLPQMRSCLPTGQAAHFGSGSMVAMCATAERSAVLEVDGEKNVYGSVYHVREPESQVLPMRFGEAAECVVAWQERRMFVRVRSPGPACAHRVHHAFARAAPA